MAHTVDEVALTTRGVGFRAGTIGNTTTIFRRETKERIRATPFGFGLNLSALDARQWSILVALGMTKGDRALRLTD
jgi:hypothetical protein